MLDSLVSAFRESPAAAGALVALLAFLAVGAVDGMYFHIYRYKLYARPESRYEHHTHTVRSFLIVGIIVALFALPSAGPLLWAAVGLVVVDQIVEFADGLSEHASRASLGGLSRAEYLAHLSAVTFRAVALVLAFVARPAAAWSPSASSLSTFTLPPALTLVAWILVPGTVIGAIHHLILSLRPLPGASSSSVPRVAT